MFEHMTPPALDPIMALMQTFRADPRTDKINLIAGVYKDDNGNVPILSTVKTAEARLLEQETTKNYVAIGGDAEFNAHVPPLVFGTESAVLHQQRVVCVQTPGGSGAIKVGCDAVHRIHPNARVWLSTPTWGNHAPIATDAGLRTTYYPYFRRSDRGLDADAMLAHLDAHTTSGDVVLLHACCHNPTGVDLHMSHWQALTELFKKRNVLPFVDCAYQGFGHGLEQDAEGMRYMAERVDEMLIANSFSKNFGIYRERCGALTVLTKTPRDCTDMQQMLHGVIRSNYSMPPSHGARIVATVFSDPLLRQEWEAELSKMRERITTTRQDLQSRLHMHQITTDLSFLTQQVGMFSFTGFTPAMVVRLRNEFGIYMAEDGRINIAGIGKGNIDTVANGFAAVLHNQTPLS